jgi:transcriptional regulator with XRE-family HTH domain
MTLYRKARGLSLEDVAREVGTDQGNLSRVEKGQQIPKRPLARALYFFFEREIPLGAIYDPEFYNHVPIDLEGVKRRLGEDYDPPTKPSSGSHDSAGFGTELV